MRATGRLCAILCALLALLPVSAARAKITPVPRPVGVAAAPAAGHSGSLIAPLSRPGQRTTVRPARRPVASARPTTLRQTIRVAPRHAFVPASSYGGRERLWRVVSRGGRHAPALAALVPTPLASVGSGDVLPAYSPPWPAWKVVVLTLLAVAEGFVLVRLARDSRVARTSEI